MSPGRPENNGSSLSSWRTVRGPLPKALEAATSAMPGEGDLRRLWLKTSPLTRDPISAISTSPASQSRDLFRGTGNCTLL